VRGTVSDLIEGDEMGRRPIISGSLEGGIRYLIQYQGAGYDQGKDSDRRFIDQRLIMLAV
jgi:hypothetical protein